MTRSVFSRSVAAAAVASFIAVAASTSASADEPAAALSFAGEAGTLTLPAGDSVRDTTSLTISSDLATSASIVIRNTANSEVVATLTSVDLAGEGTPATVDLSVAGLPAGNLEVVATPTVGESITAPLTVGSGAPVNVSLGLAKSTLFTYAYSTATPRSTTATVTATDETGLGVAFTGKVTAVVGGKSKVVAANSSTGNPAAVTLSSTGLGYGTGTATATVTGKEGTTNSSDAVSLSVRQLAFSSVSIATSSASVYPYKDYYYDSLKITVTPKSSAGITFGASGSVKITRNGKTVKSWTLTSSSAKALTWDGKVGGKIVPGTYKITASIKGKEGSTRTYAKNVVVKSNKLVTKTRTVTYTPDRVFTECYDFSWYAEGSCGYWSSGANAGDIYLDSYGSDYVYSLLSEGSLAIPSDVVSGAKYGGAKAAVTIHVLSGSGYADLDYGPDPTDYATGKVLSRGSNTLSTVSVPNGSKRLYLSIGLADYASLWVDGLTVKYTYKVLQ